MGNFAMRRKLFSGILGLTVLTIAFSAAASAATNATPSPSASSGNPYGAGAVDPARPNDPTLTILNGKKKFTFTLKKLMALHPVKITIYEPFVKRTETFTAIPLKTLFTLSGIQLSATVVTKALNDYVYTNKASKFISAKGYLAVKRSGVDIPYDQGGPIRLIYPDNSVWARFLDPWNWSLSLVSVKA